MDQIFDFRYAPLQWRGGRIQDVFKQKGSPSDCNNSRGLLISDHIGKAFTSILKEQARPTYEAAVHEEQCGCISHRGTEFATHLVRSFIDYCHVNKMCYFILFVDLEKAFDKIVREFVLGLPEGLQQDPIEYLTSLGLSSDVSATLVQDILTNGPFLQQIGIPSEYVELMTSLHSSSWFTYGKLRSALVTRKGGRQGCKLGDLIFNLVYERALTELREKLRGTGAIMNLDWRPDIPFSASSCA